MKNTNQRTNRLSIAVLIFVAILIIGLVSISKPEFEYQYSISETLDQILSLEGEMTPDKLMELVYDESPGYKVVDIRNPYEFVKGSVVGSINIPFQNFLAEENIEFFDKMKKDSITVVLCGWDQTEANGPWLVLKQLGYSNVKILLGGYGYYSGKTVDMGSESEIPEYLVEEPKYSFVDIMNDLTNGAVVEEATVKHESIIPMRKKKKAVVEGGC
jgi:rhodanese-related sulfurtransferase